MSELKDAQDNLEDALKAIGEEKVFFALERSKTFC